jgi:hypothetical protein
MATAGKHRILERDSACPQDPGSSGQSGGDEANDLRVAEAHPDKQVVQLDYRASSPTWHLRPCWENRASRLKSDDNASIR